MYYSAIEILLIGINQNLCLGLGLGLVFVDSKHKID